MLKKIKKAWNKLFIVTTVTAGNLMAAGDGTGLLSNDLQQDQNNVRSIITNSALLTITIQTIIGGAFLYAIYQIAKILLSGEGGSKIWTYFGGIVALGFLYYFIFMAG